MKKTTTYAFILALMMIGPLVKAQEVTIFPTFWGLEYYQDDQELEKEQFMILLKTHDTAYAHWKKGKTQEIVSGVAALGQIGFLIWGLEELYRDGVSDRDRANAAIGPILASLGTGVIAAVFVGKSYTSKRKAVLAYNKQFDQKTTFRVVPSLNQNGLGVALQF